MTIRLVPHISEIWLLPPLHAVLALARSCIVNHFRTTRSDSLLHYNMHAGVHEYPCKFCCISTNFNLKAPAQNYMYIIILNILYGKNIYIYNYINWQL